MSGYFIAFDLFHVIAFMMFGGLVFLVAQEAFMSVRFRIQDRRRAKLADPDLESEIANPSVAAGFRLHEPDTALRHLHYHRIPARTLSWTGSQLVARPPDKEELHLRR